MMCLIEYVSNTFYHFLTVLRSDWGNRSYDIVCNLFPDVFKIKMSFVSL